MTKKKDRIEILTSNALATKTSDYTLRLGQNNSHQFTPGSSGSGGTLQTTVRNPTQQHNSGQLNNNKVTVHSSSYDTYPASSGRGGTGRISHNTTTTPLTLGGGVKGDEVAVGSCGENYKVDSSSTLSSIRYKNTTSGRNQSDSELTHTNTTVICQDSDISSDSECGGEGLTDCAGGDVLESPKPPRKIRQGGGAIKCRSTDTMDSGIRLVIHQLCRNICMCFVICENKKKKSVNSHKCSFS